MRRSGMAFVVLSILLAVVLGIGAYSIGYHHGLAANGSVEVARYVGWHAYGFFPFGLLLFPLFFITLFALMRVAFWRGGWGGHHDHHGPWGGGPGGSMGTGRREAFEDWHRRQHDAGPPSGAPPGEEQAAT